MRLLVRISNQAGEEGEKGSVEKIQMLKSLQYCITWTDPRQCPLPDQRAGTQCPAWRCTACSPSWPAQQRTAWPGLGRYRVQGEDREYTAESIEWFKKDQASRTSYDLFGSSSPPPSSPVGNLSLFHNLPVCRRLTGEEVGGGAESYRLRERMVLYKSYNTLSYKHRTESVRNPSQWRYPGRQPKGMSILSFAILNLRLFDIYHDCRPSKDTKLKDPEKHKTRGQNKITWNSVHIVHNAECHVANLTLDLTKQKKSNKMATAKRGGMRQPFYRNSQVQ